MPNRYTRREDRRKIGRPRNPNQRPADKTVRIRTETLDKIDRAVPIMRMSLGDKIDQLATEKLSQKKVIGQQWKIDPRSYEYSPEELALWQNNNTYKTKCFTIDPADDENEGIIVEND